MTSGHQDERGLSLILRPQPVDQRQSEVGFWRPGTGTCNDKASAAEP